MAPKARVRYECSLCDWFVITGGDEKPPIVCPQCKSLETMHETRRVNYDDGK